MDNKQMYKTINQFIDYGLSSNLIGEEDVVYVLNQLMDFFKLPVFSRESVKSNELPDILNKFCDYASEIKLIDGQSPTERDLFDTKMMNFLMPRPSEVVNNFRRLYKKSPIMATDYFYSLALKSNYIRTNRLLKNVKWQTLTDFGELDITINLAKPEKDPKDIVKASTTIKSDYPKCLLCYENMGFVGNYHHPARETLRLIPIKLGGETWYFQYSPYVYYNEHAIVLAPQHRPMHIDHDTFARLLDFVTLFPHYFMGSNADLPIVGGSILSHDHFQGGRYRFAMEEASIIASYQLLKYCDVSIGYLKWPLDVISLTSLKKNEIVEVADAILRVWQNYDAPEIKLISHTGEVCHNTITPIARRMGEYYQLDLVLRNNRTDAESPDGIFHPQPNLYHIKKENIGLIEVMGLAVLPARLKAELQDLASILVDPSKEDALKVEPLAKHADWYQSIKNKYSSITQDNVEAILQDEVGLRFMEVLECCGVFRFGNSKEEVHKIIDLVRQELGE